MRFAKLFCVTVGLLALTSIGNAGSYPERNISVVVPFGAGGGTDTQARIILNGIERELGASMIVVNKPGAGGEIGTVAIAKSPADGYNLGVITYSDSAIRTGYKDVDYKNSDLEYIATYTKSPVVLITNPSANYKDLEGFVNYAKKNPGKLTVAVVSDAHNMSSVMLRKEADIDITPVFYKSGSKALNALLGGHVDAAMIAVQFAKVAATQDFPTIAIAGKERIPSLPDSPTFMEKGYNVAVTQSRVLVAPKGTPEEILKSLEEACIKADKAGKVKKKIDNLGEVYQFMNRADLAEFSEEVEGSIMPIVRANKDYFVKK